MKKIDRIEEQYQKAYGSMPNDQALALLDFESKIADRKTEKVVIVDKAGSTLIEKTGTAKRVRFNIIPGRSTDAVLTHNHPSCTSFSENDLRSFFKLGLRELRVVCGGPVPCLFRLRAKTKHLPISAKAADKMIQAWRLILGVIFGMKKGVTLKDSSDAAALLWTILSAERLLKEGKAISYSAVDMGELWEAWKAGSIKVEKV